MTIANELLKRGYRLGALSARDRGLLRRIIREEIGSLKGDMTAEDRLLEAEEAAKLLCVSEDWLYRHAKKLPFTRKLGSKMLRFSANGIQKYLATRK